MDAHASTRPQGFVDLLEAFADAEVRYLVIGGYAVSFHDRPRTTKDLGLLIDQAPDHIRRACSAALAFGAQADIAARPESAIESQPQPPAGSASSPRGRGNPRQPAVDADQPGCIPACAGEPA